MQIVTDSGADIFMTPEEQAELNIHVVPLVVTIGGKSYREGVDITKDKFYRLLKSSGGLPKTSQPSAGDFAEVYRKLAADDPRNSLRAHVFRVKRHLQLGGSRGEDG